MKPNDINILVVDDVPENLITIEALLARPGLNIIKVESGPEALEVLLAQEVALALLDVQMPDMDGFELAELIRGSERTRSVPLIFLTAGARESKTTFRGYEAGAVDFLYKPLDVLALQSKVNVFVDLYKKEKLLSKQLEELRQALALNELFTAVLGHDLRNPLSAVINGADLITRISSDPIVKSTSGRIQSSGKRMAKMVEQLLDVARIRAGGIDLHVKEVDYELLSKVIADELDGLNTGSRIDIQKNGNTVGLADPDRLSQILSNLLGNAIQHGTDSQRIKLLIDGTNDADIVIQVQNDGVIPQLTLDTLFEPFQSRQSSEKTKQGLGLGLYIVKRFTEAHGGKVQVVSNDTVGTIFKLTMPRKTFTSATIGLKRPHTLVSTID